MTGYDGVSRRGTYSTVVSCTGELITTKPSRTWPQPLSGSERHIGRGGGATLPYLDSFPICISMWLVQAVGFTTPHSPRSCKCSDTPLAKPRACLLRCRHYGTGIATASAGPVALPSAKLLHMFPAAMIPVGFLSGIWDICNATRRLGGFGISVGLVWGKLTTLLITGFLRQVTLFTEGHLTRLCLHVIKVA
jgi:hypothetical protein